MCFKCELRRRDPRFQAFRAIGVIEFVTALEWAKAEPAIPLIDSLYFTDAGIAKMESMVMMQDPAIERVRTYTLPVCLN